MGKKRLRSSNPHKKAKHAAHFRKLEAKKDRNVRRSSHGKFETVAALEDYKARKKAKA